MTEQTIQSLLSKLALLERQTGQHVSYQFFPPFEKAFQDHVAIQKAAKQVANFIGLNDLTFVVGVTKQKNNVGGHIELDRWSKEVFIEITNDTDVPIQSLGATLCHEICHKWLQVHELELPDKFENEILTDITAVFLGFGKQMLNGCKCVNQRWRKIGDKTQTITNTRNTGYLDLEQLSFVYSIVCAMRHISNTDSIVGLNAEATSAIAECDALYARYYDPRLHHLETRQEIFANIEKDIIRTQTELSILDKHLAYVKIAYCDTLEKFLGIWHNKLHSMQHKATELSERNEPDPALRFIEASLAKLHFAQLRRELDGSTRESMAYTEHATTLGQCIQNDSNLFPAPSPSMFNIVKCPHDGTQLRLPEKSGDLVVSCPICKYRFQYNTNPVSFGDQKAHQKWTWFVRVKNFFVDDSTTYTTGT